jgi:hypothetical protein
MRMAPHRSTPHYSPWHTINLNDLQCASCRTAPSGSGFEQDRVLQCRSVRAGCRALMGRGADIVEGPPRVRRPVGRRFMRRPQTRRTNAFAMLTNEGLRRGAEGRCCCCTMSTWGALRCGCWGGAALPGPQWQPWHRAALTTVALDCGRGGPGPAVGALSNT